MGKLLKEVYKTYEGALKRASFENGLARYEFARGIKARHHYYVLVCEGNTYRVKRELGKKRI